MAADRIRFHQRVYRFLSPVVRAWIGRRFSMTYPEVPELPDHFLLISNHVTNYDMFIVGLTLRAHMYFVSTEHIFRLGLFSNMWTIGAFVLGAGLLHCILLMRFFSGAFGVSLLNPHLLLIVWILSFLPSLIIQIVKAIRYPKQD